MRRLMVLAGLFVLMVSFTACSGGSGGGGGGGNATASKAVAVTAVGLGESILVTNQSTVTINGIAESDIGINQILLFNETTQTSGATQGTTSWNGTIALREGDNVIKMTAVAKDGTTATTTSTITYYQALALTTPLTPSKDIITVNQSTNIIFTLGVKSDVGDIVTLYKTDKNGVIAGIVGKSVGTMVDNGVLPDEIQQDGVYTLKITEAPTTEGYMYYRAGVTKANGTIYYSESKAIWITQPLANSTVQTSVDIADSVKKIYDDALAAGKDSIYAAGLAYTALKNNPDIGAVGTTAEGGTWWVTTKGLLGLYSPSLDNQKSNDGASGKGMYARGSRPSYIPKVRAENYPAAYLNNRSQYAPSYLTSSGGGARLFTAATSTANEIKSKKGIIISPYINNPNSTNNFGTDDDYFVPWKTIQTNPTCGLYAAKEIVNYGSINVSLDSFKNLGDYGYIHISSHGDNFYNGLLSWWQDVWGPNDFLKGSLSVVVVKSGIFLSKNIDGSWNTTGYADDINAKRVAIGPNGSVAILPSFIKYYVGKLPNSLVVLSSCRSMYNNSMANAFLAKGAGAVVGYSDYVNAGYSQNTLNTIVQEMLSGKKLGDAVSKAIQTWGSNDKDGDPAYLKMTGANDLVLSAGSCQNAGFEDGYLSPWQKDGDGRIITKLGITSPTEGSFMALISTGLGYTTDSGSVQQDFCVPPVTQNEERFVSFDWNFFSEEFKEYCGSIYQDSFNVTICEIDYSTNAQINCSTLFNRKVDDLCSSVVKSDVSFDRGDVWMTGWQKENLNITGYAGKKVNLTFSAHDVGDSIYDTAVLIDNIKIQ